MTPLRLHTHLLPRPGPVWGAYPLRPGDVLSAILFESTRGMCRSPPRAARAALAASDGTASLRSRRSEQDQA